MKTAQNIPRIGLAKAKGPHLEAANETPHPMPPALVKRWQDKGWKYIPANETDIRKTFAKFQKPKKGAPK
jgi:hypothetical protein